MQEIFLRDRSTLALLGRQRGAFYRKAESCECKAPANTFQNNFGKLKIQIQFNMGMILYSVDASFGGTLYSNCKFLGAQEPKIFASSRVPFNYFSRNSNLIQHSVFRYFLEHMISSQSFFKLWNTELGVHFDCNLDLLTLVLFGSFFIIFFFYKPTSAPSPNPHPLSLLLPIHS